MLKLRIEDAIIMLCDRGRKPNQFRFKSHNKNNADELFKTREEVKAKYGMTETDIINLEKQLRTGKWTVTG